MISLIKKIEKRMLRTPDEVFYPSDFFDLDRPLRVNKALSRMVQNEKAWRLSRGVYVTYKTNKYGKTLAFSSVLADSYARKNKVTITEIGAAAANLLGFSTQNVINEIYLTTGKPAQWEFKARTIEFRKGTGIEMFFGQTNEGKLIRAWNYMEELQAVETFPYLKPNIASTINWDAIINVERMFPSWMRNLARNGKLKNWNKA
jgi:hypothetical protein